MEKQIFQLTNPDRQMKATKKHKINKDIVHKDILGLTASQDEDDIKTNNSVFKNMLDIIYHKSDDEIVNNPGKCINTIFLSSENSLIFF